MPSAPRPTSAAWAERQRLELAAAAAAPAAPATAESGLKAPAATLSATICATSGTCRPHPARLPPRPRALPRLSRRRLSRPRPGDARRSTTSTPWRCAPSSPRWPATSVGARSQARALSARARASSASPAARARLDDEPGGRGAGRPSSRAHLPRHLRPGEIEHAARSGRRRRAAGAARPGAARAALRLRAAGRRARRRSTGATSTSRAGCCGSSARAARSAWCRSAGRPSAALRRWLASWAEVRGLGDATRAGLSQPPRRPAERPLGAAGARSLRAPARRWPPASIRTPCATPSPPTCSRAAPICGRSRSCSATARCPPPRSTPTSRSSGCWRSTASRTRGRGGAPDARAGDDAPRRSCFPARPAAGWPPGGGGSAGCCCDGRAADCWRWRSHAVGRPPGAGAARRRGWPRSPCSRCG